MPVLPLWALAAVFRLNLTFTIDCEYLYHVSVQEKYTLVQSLFLEGVSIFQMKRIFCQSVIH